MKDGNDDETEQARGNAVIPSMFVLGQILYILGYFYFIVLLLQSNRLKPVHSHTCLEQRK